MTITTTTPTTAELFAAAKAAEEREHLARWALPSGSGPIGYADQARCSAHDAAKEETAAAWAALKTRPDWEVVWARRYAPEAVAASEARMRSAGSGAP
jgi:hypothetical protein